MLGGVVNVPPANVDSGLALIDSAIAEHHPSRVFALFSGGHDSLSATAVAAKHPHFTAAVHCNTGIGVPETREFVRETCREQEWRLIELEHPTKVYEEMVLEYGFPGAGAHPYCYVLLKERLIDQLIREHKQHWFDRIVLVSGARQQESKRRMLNVPDSPIERDGAQVWVNAIWDWSKPDVNEFIDEEGLRRNPVVDLIHKSGECLCGAYADGAEERQELQMWLPHVDAEIRALEERVEAAGHHACIWEADYPNVHPDQQVLFSRLRMCQSCEARRVAA